MPHDGKGTITVKKLLTIALALALCLGLPAGCGKGGGKTIDSPLVGTWQATPQSAAMGFDMRITFAGDGTFHGEKTFGSDVEITDGRFTLGEDNTLTMYYPYQGDQDREDVFTYDRQAMNCTGFYWYVDGDTLFVGEVEMRRAAG